MSQSRALLALPALPEIRPALVFHVGSLRSADKRNGSMEGAGLSVSLCPQAWTEIAELGGHPTWALFKADARFIDFHRLGQRALRALRDWGVERGLITLETRYKAIWADEDGERFMWCDTAEAARAEVEDRDNARCQRARNVPVPTEVLRRLTHNAQADASLALDLVATVYAQQSGFDGVWWEDALDPLSLSAPRGVIVSPQVPSWGVREATAEDFAEHCIEAEFS